MSASSYRKSRIVGGGFHVFTLAEGRLQRRTGHCDIHVYEVASRGEGVLKGKEEVEDSKAVAVTVSWK